MSPVRTRTFFRERKGHREFLELSWIGLEAEVASGKVGTNGRVREHAFESPEELEAFLADEVRKALASGYVEQLSGATLDTPEPEPERDEAARIADMYQRPAWFPVTEVGEGSEQGSRFGGRPYLALGESWPACGVCSRPMHFIVQLETATLPGAIRSELPEGLLQLFLCDRECQSEGGWEAFARTTHARVLGAESGRLAEEPDAQFPPKRIVRWEQRDDHPTYEDLLELVGVDAAVEASERMEERKQGAAPGEKLGGWPHWIQSPEHPACRKCRARMEPLLQIDSNQTLPIQFGDVGVGWVIRCLRCNTLSFLWQCG